ncbi:MAG TPA: hypothetical protein VJ506_01980 [Candidatus Limnocylindrales bacterium]|nr:hypothetical protein [Candidatus Limnocylindrales bacterium]
MDRSRELVAALVAVVLITVAYAGVAQGSGVPAASGLMGHGLGIAGFALMLLTETAYSFRKRAMKKPRGSMRAWLRVHIFTGIVGPYLVVLHSAWSFNGLAGAVTAMTILVVASGFIGRYIYTAVPRTADGVIVEARELQAMVEATRREAAGGLRLAAVGPAPAAIAAAPGRTNPDRAATDRLRELERQLAALRWARRALATWHAIHVPIGMALFVLAFLHVGAALYYATLLR